MGTLSRTWRLMRASWIVLQQDRELIAFPLFSGICLLALIALSGLAAFGAVGGGFTLPEGLGGDFLGYAALFVFYYIAYFIIIFFNTALIASAILRMAGGDPTVSYGLRAALSRLGVIAGWALVASTVGLILNALEERLGRWGRIGVSLLGVAWSAATFFVVPIIAVEGKGPLAALRASAAMVRNTWGEQVTSAVGFGLASFLLSLPAVFLGGYAVLTLNTPTGLAVAGLSGLYLMTIVLILAALHGIFETAMYAYASGGDHPGFAPELLRDSVRRK